MVEQPLGCRPEEGVCLLLTVFKNCFPLFYVQGAKKYHFLLVTSVSCSLVCHSFWCGWESATSSGRLKELGFKSRNTTEATF